MKALGRGDVHGKRPVLYLGREDSGTSMRVPVTAEMDGKVNWQREWVEKELKKKRVKRELTR